METAESLEVRRSGGPDVVGCATGVRLITIAKLGRVSAHPLVTVSNSIAELEVEAAVSVHMGVYSACN